MSIGAVVAVIAIIAVSSYILIGIANKPEGDISVSLLKDGDKQFIFFKIESLEINATNIEDGKKINIEKQTIGNNKVKIKLPNENSAEKMKIEMIFSELRFSSTPPPDYPGKPDYEILKDQEDISFEVRCNRGKLKDEDKSKDLISITPQDSGSNGYKLISFVYIPEQSMSEIIIYFERR